MIYAYLRVSTDKQQLENQRHEIINYTKRKSIKIDKWIEESVSGMVEKDNRKIGDILSILKEGDTLIVTEVSRLSRTMMELMEIMNACLKRGVSVCSIKEDFVLNNSINSKILLFAFGLSSEVERKLISTRTKEALARKKTEGIVLGRPIGRSVKIERLIKNEQAIKEMLESKVNLQTIAKKFGVSRQTLYRFLKNWKFNQEDEKL